MHRITAVRQNGGLSAKFNGSSSFELLYKTEHLSFDFRHFAKLQNVCEQATTSLPSNPQDKKYPPLPLHLRYGPVSPPDNPDGGHEHQQAVDGRRDGHGGVLQQSGCDGDAQGTILDTRLNGNGDTLFEAMPRPAGGTIADAYREQVEQEGGRADQHFTVGCVPTALLGTLLKYGTPGKQIPKF